ncbi:4765_t:CDS:2 [Entrophospora sp. SA101]|nr:6612_t:CDS:2 [Entrophospora sp. SA101]CAJ0747612.1 4765_t:CDS:2 [Entrophospora sp. SA101]CAJ0916467.1 12542_t:CDS:2 [Entrophospora sp. SA101]
MSSFRIVLVEGIRGGFKPPTVRRRIEINGDENGGVVNDSALVNRELKSKQGVVTSNQVKEFSNDVRENLSKLPTESDQASEDIYGFDTSITFQSEDFEWRNGCAEGCIQSISEVKPTAEQKAAFKALIEKVKSLGQQYAVNEV